ncbi:MAG: glycosyltransferase [Proteobacteria bacterium]|nr:glycosyltransferase [Pseudomonadota bacterium]
MQLETIQQEMTSLNPLRVAALIDLPRSPLSGGHIKGWERIAQAAAQSDLPLDLTLYCSGETLTETLSDKARIKQLPPVFSTEKLKFLPYVPDNTDLAKYHRTLAEELIHYDVIHTTDGFFAYAQTAEKVKATYGIPIVTSFHTDTPAYARVFTKLTIEKIFGEGILSKFLIETLRLPERQEAKKRKRLKKHLTACSAALYTREEDHQLAASVIGDENTHVIRLGVDRHMFGPHRMSRDEVEVTYRIPAEQVIILFVGRLDVGKNIYTLIEALENLIAEGKPVHLITAGLGPAANDLKERLGDHVTVAGFVHPEDLAVLYASADLLALTSEVEIRSMAGVEAMTSGLPVLVSEKSGIAKLFDYTPAMDVVPSGVENWTNALRDIVNSKNKRIHMSKVASAYADTHIANWTDVLAEDLLPVWHKAAIAAKIMR